jgi:TRAP-type C4-dicarboxylate transport system permease small subunit
MRQALQRIDDWICRICGWLIAAAIAFLIGLNFTQLVTRYFVDIIFLWAEELSMVLIVWICAVGAPWVTLNRSHLKMDAATPILPKSVKNVAHWAIHFLIFAMAVAFIWSGINTVDANAGFSLSVMGFDEGFRYVPLVVEGVLLLLAELVSFGEDILDKKSGKLVIE